eukprot:3002472-Pleurochrysis_carterae.AAC.2
MDPRARVRAHSFKRAHTTRAGVSVLTRRSALARLEHVRVGRRPRRRRRLRLPPGAAASPARRAARVRH